MIQMIRTLRLKALGWLRGVPQECHEDLQWQMDLCASSLEQTRNALRNLERLLGTKMAEHVMERINDSMVNAVRRQISKAVYKAHGQNPDPDWMINVEVAASELRWLDPDSIERRVLEEWKRKSAQNLRARAVVDLRGDVPMDMPAATVLDIRVPELGYRHRILDSILA